MHSFRRYCTVLTFCSLAFLLLFLFPCAFTNAQNQQPAPESAEPAGDSSKAKSDLCDYLSELARTGKLEEFIKENLDAHRVANPSELNLRDGYGRKLDGNSEVYRFDVDWGKDGRSVLWCRYIFENANCQHDVYYLSDENGEFTLPSSGNRFFACDDGTCCLSSWQAPFLYESKLYHAYFDSNKEVTIYGAGPSKYEPVCKFSYSEYLVTDITSNCADDRDCRSIVTVLKQEPVVDLLDDETVNLLGHSFNNSFEDATGSLICSARDINNDGRPDLVCETEQRDVRSSGKVKLFIQGSNGVYSKVEPDTWQNSFLKEDMNNLGRGTQLSFISVDERTYAVTMDLTEAGERASAQYHVYFVDDTVVKDVGKIEAKLQRRMKIERY